MVWWEILPLKGEVTCLDANLCEVWYRLVLPVRNLGRKRGAWEAQAWALCWELMTFHNWVQRWQISHLGAKCKEAWASLRIRVRQRLLLLTWDLCGQERAPKLGPDFLARKGWQKKFLRSLLGSRGEWACIYKRILGHLPLLFSSAVNLSFKYFLSVRDIMRSFSSSLLFIV